MSASKNPDSMTPAQGEFHSSVKPSEPLTRKGHAPGVLVGNEALPEFHAEAHPAGTAPENRTFKPQNPLETPAQALDPEGENRASAADTITGATSKDVHTGYGHPGSGQVSADDRRKNPGSGLEGVGANPSDPMVERGLDRDHEPGPRSKKSANVNLEGANDRVPTSAEELASERR